MKAPLCGEKNLLGSEEGEGDGEGSLLLTLKSISVIV